MKRELEETKLRYKLASKKIEYFLSWTAGAWSAEVERAMSQDVREFVADWRPSDVRAEESPTERLMRGICGDGDSNGGEREHTGLLVGDILSLGGPGPGLVSEVED